MNENEKKLYMEGYEQACKDINNHQIYAEAYKYGIQIENENIIRNLDEYLYELNERRKNGEVVIGYWQVKDLINELKNKVKIGGNRRCQ